MEGNRSGAARSGSAVVERISRALRRGLSKTAAGLHGIYGGGGGRSEEKRGSRGGGRAGGPAAAGGAARGRGENGRGADGGRCGRAKGPGSRRASRRPVQASDE